MTACLLERSVVLLLALTAGPCAASSVKVALSETTQSSLLNEKGHAGNAVDGDQTSCSHTQTQMDPWWRADLPPNSYNITTVIITNRGDCCEEKINGAQIRIGNSLENHGNSNPLATIVRSIPAGDTIRFKFNPIGGRYLNVFLPGTDKTLTLCEVEVYTVHADPTPVTILPSFVPTHSPSTSASERPTLVQTHTDKGNSVEVNWAMQYQDRHCHLTFILLSCHAAPLHSSSWWRADLSTPCSIQSVTIDNRDARCYESISGSRIRVGNSLEENGSTNPPAALVDSIVEGKPREYSWSPVSARYVYISRTGLSSSTTQHTTKGICSALLLMLHFLLMYLSV